MPLSDQPPRKRSAWLVTKSRDACVWTFMVANLAEAEFYTVEAGRRGGPTYSRAEMEAMDWTVALEIGN